MSFAFTMEGAIAMQIQFYPTGVTVQVPEGISVLEAQRLAGLLPDAPCAGHGTCGKCRVRIGDTVVLACQTEAKDGMRVWVDPAAEHQVLTEGLLCRAALDRVPPDAPYLAAVDIGTTTVVCHILDGRTGDTLSTVGRLNPQHTFGADVVSRIQLAREQGSAPLTEAIRRALSEILELAASEAGAAPEQISVLSIVGNPCMQQLFLGIPVDNLASPPFTPAVRRAESVPAERYIPRLSRAALRIVPDISGYLGADIMGCILASRLFEQDALTLLVDIGTNGEMVLGSAAGMVACATAAGPALEGANITCGMRGADGAIDHVWAENGDIAFSVIGGGSPQGICGSGLIDAAAVLLQEGIIDRRGRMQTAEQLPQYAHRLFEQEGLRCFALSPTVTITQDDIRELQLAKGAIAAGIDLMMKHLGVSAEQIGQVLLAGAFGTYIRIESACGIGLIPSSLESRTRAVGNAAASGSRLIALDGGEFLRTERLCQQIHTLELAALPEFSRCFARHMRF